MIKKVLTLYLSVYLIAGSFAMTGKAHAQDEKVTYTLAVMDLVAIGVSEIEARGLSDKLRSQITELVQQGENLKETYELIERTQMDKIFEEFETQSTGCVSDSCAVEFGKMLGADRMVVGSVSLVGRTYSVSARIVNVEDAKVIKASSKSHRGSIDDVLTQVIPEVGNDLILIQKKSKLMWYLLGAVVIAGGGAGAAMMGGGGGDTPPEDLPVPPVRPLP